MNAFIYKDLYEENGRKVLEMNILPEKYCNFDCIFCPIGRSHNHTDKVVDFGGISGALAELGTKIAALKPDLVFINSKGETLVHSGLKQVIDFIHAKGCAVRLLSNGYLLGRGEYAALANLCEECIGEIKTVAEEDFQKVQRPLPGYTLRQYIEGMAQFKKQYPGHFIFETSIIKKYTESDAAFAKLQQIINAISPDELRIVDIGDERFMKVLGVTPKRLKEAHNTLHI